MRSTSSYGCWMTFRLFTKCATSVQTRWNADATEEADLTGLDRAELTESKLSGATCATKLGAIAHPMLAYGETGDLVANTNWRTASTEVRLAFAALTMERKAA